MDNSGQYGRSINNFHGQPMMAPNAVPVMNQQHQEKKDHSGIIKTVCLIFVSLLAVTFIGLFVYMYIQWDTATTDVNGQIDKAVAESELKLREQLEDEFAEKEKYPYRTFGGPTDLGSLSFEYPKTWSVYIPNENTSDYRAYLNPGYVANVSDKTVMALRVSIVNKATESVKSDYAKKVKDGKLTYTTKIINGVAADIYKGVVNNTTGYNVIICVIKIRDKTAIIQTDAVIFEEDFNRILETIKYNA